MAFGTFQAQIIGNLGFDPEMKYTPEGRAVTTFRVGVTPPSKDKQTYWVRVTAWGKDAENANQFLAKGSQVFVSGDLVLREYEGKNGKGQSLELSAQRISFLSQTPGAAARVEEEVTDGADLVDAAGKLLATPQTAGMDF